MKRRKTDHPIQAPYFQNKRHIDVVSQPWIGPDFAYMVPILEQINNKGEHIFWYVKTIDGDIILTEGCIVSIYIFRDFEIVRVEYE